MAEIIFTYDTIQHHYLHNLIENSAGTQAAISCNLKFHANAYLAVKGVSSAFYQQTTAIDQLNKGTYEKFRARLNAKRYPELHKLMEKAPYGIKGLVILNLFSKVAEMLVEEQGEMNDIISIFSSHPADGEIVTHISDINYPSPEGKSKPDDSSNELEGSKEDQQDRGSAIIDLWTGSDIANL
ncbi:MAG: hypothetical protein V3T17_09785 [Pseudomonadales bacterium]